MKYEKIILILVYVLLFSLVGIFIFQRYEASVTGKFYYSNENLQNMTFNEICNQLKLVTSTKYNQAVVVKGNSLFLNPNLLSELKLPNELIKFYNTSKSPILYDYNPERENIVIIGDSFSEGDDVAFDESYPYYLSEKMNYNIINLGIGGYNTKMEIDRLFQIGLKYHPKLIIWQFCYNDAQDTYNFGSFVFGVFEKLGEQGLICRDRLDKKNVFGNKLIKYYYENINNLDEQERINKNIVQPLYHFEAILKNKDIPVIGVMLPSTKRFWKYFPAYFLKNITILDMEKEMNFSGWKPPFTVNKYRMHFSPQTNKELAKLLAKKINETLNKKI